MSNESLRCFSYILDIEARAAHTVAARSASSRRGRRRDNRAPVETLESRTLLSGLTIIPTFASNITSDPHKSEIEAAINAGIKQIESDFSNPITVNIKFQEGGGLGGSTTYFVTVSYSSYRAALVSHEVGANQASAIASLPTGSNNPVNGNSQINVTTANARALGLSTSTGSGGFDSIITLNTAICNPVRTSINLGEYDLQAVAMHETDEALGIGSALTGIKNGAPTPTGPVRPEDLYRYTSGGARSFTTSATASAYFSIDGGKTDLAQFNQHYSGDDNDWYSYNVPHVAQVQDAYDTAGVIPYYNVEPVVLDVLGYTPTRVLGTGIVTGVVFNDINGNGVKDSGDPIVSGWTIEAVQSGHVITSTVSNAYGYQLTSLPDGSYMIEEVPQTGYSETTPIEYYNVTISGHNQTIAGKNFGNTSTLLIKMTSSLNDVDLSIDYDDANNLLVTSHGGVIETVPLNSFSSVSVSGGNSITNSLTVDYGHGFFSQPVTYTGGTGSSAKNSLSVLDDGSSGTRQWDANASSFVALDTGKSLNPTVNFNNVQTVSLTGRSSGSESILAQDTSHSGITLPATTTLHINNLDAVNLQGIANPFVIDGTANNTGEDVNVGSKAPSLGGTLANINGTVTVNNISNLSADDSGDATGRNGTINATSVTGFGLPASTSLNFTSSLSSLNVHSGADDTVSVKTTGVPTNLYPGSLSTVNVVATSNPLTITGTGSGDATVVNVGTLAPSLGGTLANIHGAITVNNLSGLDVDDSGDSANQTGTISGLSITGFGSPASISYGGLGSMDVFGSKGTNTDTVTGTSATTTLYSSAHAGSTVNVKATTVSLTINGNNFADTVNVGSDAPSIGGVLTNIKGSITLTKMLSSSKLSLDDSDDGAGRSGTISGSTITGFGMANGAVLTYSGSELASLTVRGGKGVNTETISGTSTPTTLYPGTLDATTINVKATTAALTINGNDHSDTINVGSIAQSIGGTLTNIAGTITVTNTSESSTLSLDDSGDTTQRTGTISATSVTGFGMNGAASVKYVGSELQGLTVRAGSGYNTETVTGTSTATTLHAGPKSLSTINVKATGAGDPLTINGDDTPDTIVIGSLAPSLGGTLTQIAGSITVTNTSNDTDLTLDDSGDGTTRNGTLSATQITGLGMPSGVAVNYTGSQLHSLTIRGDKAGGTLTETGTSTSTTITGLTVKT